jgi:hypothetical protein
VRNDAYRHALVQGRGAVLGPPLQDVVRIALHRAYESRNAIVNVEAALSAVREAVEESTVVGPRGLVLLDGQGLKIPELLLRAIDPRSYFS